MICRIHNVNTRTAPSCVAARQNRGSTSIEATARPRPSRGERQPRRYFFICLSKKAAISVNTSLVSGAVSSRR
jgi:hypothetical protein